MTKESQNWIFSTRATQLFVRTGTIALASGVLVLTTDAKAQSQDAEAPIPAGGKSNSGPGGKRLWNDWLTYCGVVFEVYRTGKETVVHTFDRRNGWGIQLRRPGS
jgi:hypothetical protein